MDEIKEKLLKRNFALNVLYVNEDREILNNTAELFTEINGEDYGENLIKIVSCNKVLKKWRLNDHPEILDDVERMIKNGQRQLRQSPVTDEREYQCICGRTVTGISFMLPDCYPGVFRPVEPECAKEINYLLNEF